MIAGPPSALSSLFFLSPNMSAKQSSTTGYKYSHQWPPLSNSYHPRHPNLPSYSSDRDLGIAELHSRAPSPPSIAPWTVRLCRPPSQSGAWVSFTCPTCAHRPFCFSGASLILVGTWLHRHGSPALAPCVPRWPCRLQLLHHAARAAAGRRRWCGKGQLAGGRGRGGRRRGRGGGRGGRR